MKTCIAQLLERQKQFDEDSSEKKTKKAYNDLLEQYNEMTQSQTPYTMPLNFAEWKCFDIFKFLKDHEDSKRFDEIVEHIAMKSIRGGELLSCISGDKLVSL